MIFRTSLVGLVLLNAFVCFTLRAQSTNENPNASEDIRRLESEVASLRSDLGGQTNDILRHFGVGISLSHDISDIERVDNATIENGIVRVQADGDSRARIMLEWHSWMSCERLRYDELDPAYKAVRRVKREGTTREQEYWKQQPPCSPWRRAGGAFVAVQPGSDAFIDAIGVGWMARWPDKLQLFGNRTLNLGFGLVSDQDVQVLGSGFEADQPPPAGEQSVRYRETDVTGLFVIASIELGQTPVQISREPSLDFGADRTTAVVGDSVVLTWRADGTSSCMASGAWSDMKTTQGLEQLPLEAAGTQTYRLNCTGARGSVSRFVTVRVQAAAQGAPPAQ